jgi:LacI family repressor for deo operon, udp, cdd, tsx, nupC, and nupG
MHYVAVAVPYAGPWYFDAVLEGAAAEAREHDAELRVAVHAPGPHAHRAVTESFATHFEDPECLGALSVVFDLDTEDTQVLRRARPVVVVGGYSEHLPSVFVDDAEVARIATEHLLSLGHTSVAHLAGYTTAPDDFAMRGDRVRGYSAAMSAAGLDEVSRVVPSGFAYEAAHRAALQLLSDADRPSAVFAVNDDVAFAVLDAAKELGLVVPGDLSVVGVDDHRDAAGRGLTTVRQDPSALGRAAIARLLGATDEDAQCCDVELMVRSTTGAPGTAVSARSGVLGRLFGRRRR